MGEYHGTEVAVKKLRAQDVKKQQIEEFAQEVSVMVGLRHPNIVLLMGACTDIPNLCIVTGTLLNYFSLLICINGSIRVHATRISLRCLAQRKASILTSCYEEYDNGYA